MGTACLRVLAGERGDELLTSLEGISEYQAARYDREWCYKLAGGQHHRLNIQFACRGERDGLAVTRIAVERPMLEPAVQFVLQSTPADGANLGKGKFTLILQNSSSQELTNLLVKAYRGNEWVASAPVARLKGMANVPVEMELDLSTKEPLGEKIPIRFECIVDPHHPEHNGIASCTVNSMGRVVPMGTNTTVDSEYGPIKVDPKLTVMVGERLIFTDDGGVLNPYSAEQSSTLKFLPVDPKMKVRVRFVRFKTTDYRAQLTVYTVQTPGDLTLTGLRYRDILVGSVVEEGDASLSYTSEAADGGVTLYFQSVENSENEGWIAEVEQVAPQNPLSLTRVEALAQGEEAEGEVRISLAVHNAWQSHLANVVVNVLDAEGDIITTEQIP